MVTFIYGGAGSGKSTAAAELTVEALSEGKRVFVIVPEQQALMTERRIADMTDGAFPTDRLEVLNFKRLCNRVFREYGGLSFNYVRRGACALIMWQALFSVAPALREYGGMLESCDRFVPLLLSAADEFKKYSVSLRQLSDASKDLQSENPTLAGKLADISVILAAYYALLKEHYDDPADDLTKAGELLSVNGFFSGATVIIDSFDGFTKQEYDIISRIFRQAERVAVTLGYDPDDKRELFGVNVQSGRRLERLCASSGAELRKTVLTGRPRFENDELRFAEKNLFSENAGQFDQPNEAIRIIECENIYSEADAVACDIMKKLREGARCRDIAVVARDADSWNGVIDSALERLKIPYHMSKRVDLCEKPLFRLIIAALKIRTGGWRREDVISYIKTGFTDITSEECDAIEYYTEKWNINGSRWYDEYGWSMNPDGYKEEISEEGREFLVKVNAAREKLIVPLIKLFDVFADEKTSVRSASEALFRFLRESGADERSAKKSGIEGVQLWNALSDALDELVYAAGELSVTPEQYGELLSFVIRETDIGVLPATVDEVIIGSADRLRTGNIKHVYIIGANEGSFPKSQFDEGVFSENERVALETYGIELSVSGEQRTVSELYLLYKSVFCASESVTVLYSGADMGGKALKPSGLCAELQVLFPLLSPKKWRDMPSCEKIADAGTAFRYSFEKTPFGNKLHEILYENEEFRRKYEAALMPLGAENEQLGEDTAKLLFGGNVSMTQSRLDSYVLCAFGYSCKYIVRLNEDRKADIGAADTGNIIHRILEKFMRRAVLPDGKIDPELDGEKLRQLAGELVEECAEALFRDCGTGRKATNRMAALFTRLKKTVYLLMKDLTDEFRQSDFRPALFELPISNDSTRGAVPPLKIPLPDGTSAYIYGIVDRVDIFSHNGDVYFRVVDYKTGTKDFSMSDISRGLNLQMLLYLFSIWNDKGGAFLDSVGGSGKKAVPAGVLYYSAKLPGITVDPETDESEVMSRVAASLKRSGMLINDADVLKAMEKKLEGRYIPVKLKKDGGFSTAMPLETVEGFGKLMNDIESKIRDICFEMKNGRACAEPIRDSRNDACRYCAMLPVCRRGDGKRTVSEDE
ncbi:MAG: PD-(D/E)XK nuclease family protein [Firmicutes bacterium]|nr:PD-(D/E)XK nuclease family protein [Bacillota bacterium]